MDLILEDGYTKDQFAKDVQTQLEIRFPMLRRTPVVPACALTGENVEDLMPVVFHARERWSQVITTGLLNRWLKSVVEVQSPPPYQGRPTKIKYIMQTKGRPPTFLLFTNVHHIPPTYLRYMIRNFQDSFQMFGMEVRMALKKSSLTNPFHHNKTQQGTVGGREARKKRLIADLKKHGRKLKRHEKRRSKIK